MLYFFGVPIELDKKAYIALSDISGIGLKNSYKVCNSLGIHRECCLKDLTDSQISNLYHQIEQNFIVEGELRKKESFNINRLISIRCYRGFRHSSNLPVRGQRTHSNAKTQRKLGLRRLSLVKG
uniref:Ribosomal protein S13 n=1 Tax=Jakoba bahamiensis TaxID=221721 RepID=M4QDB0_9EUKA|nr:ribosomal protein S13 [Jakoba bahamiensis]AGH24165.1 ribosomal protein S13 [Jakoba bahamiensis]